MDKIQKKNLKETIKVSQSDNRDYLRDFFNLWLKTISSSIITFGISSKATKEAIKALKEYESILKIENSIYVILYKCAECIEDEAVGVYLEELFQLGEDTFNYYASFLDDILIACDLKQEHRIIRDKKNFQTLLESNEFFNKLFELTINENDVLDFLNISDDFLDFVNENTLKTIYVDYNLEREREFIGVNYKLDENSSLKDIKIFVPNIIDLNTALIFTHTCYSAYALYQRLGITITEDEIKNILNEAEEQMKLFENFIREKEKRLLPNT